jgi:aspartate ammonia-lyase
MAAEGGQLQLNAFEPLIAHNIVSSMSLLQNAIGAFTERCIDGIEAWPEQCARHIEAGVSTVTALVPLSGMSGRRHWPNRRWRRAARCGNSRC